jgi:hypothetical protein
MPITQDRFLALIEAASEVSKCYVAMGKMLRGTQTILHEATAGANHEQLIVIGALQALLDLHNNTFDAFTQVSATIEIERRHFLHAAARNDRNRAKQRRMREVAVTKLEGRDIDRFFEDGKIEKPRTEADTDFEIANIEMVAAEVVTKLSTLQYRTTALPREPGETLGAWSKRLTRYNEMISGRISDVKPEVSEVETEVEPTYGETVEPPPPTLAEQRGNAETSPEDLKKPDFTPDQNPL